MDEYKYQEAVRIAKEIYGPSLHDHLEMMKSLSADYTAELRGPLTDDVMQRLAERNAARLEQLRRKK